MAYTDFTLNNVVRDLGLIAQVADLFPNSPTREMPSSLKELLQKGLRQPLISEKSRSEFIVVPILLATQDLASRGIAIYSGQRLDVDSEKGLTGECDFILAASPPLPSLNTPILTVVEAKKHDIENAIGQCIAQMVGARMFNEQTGKDYAQMYGCVTNGENWHFLRLEGAVVVIDQSRYYIDNVNAILGILLEIVSRPAGSA
jgi:hypothetical protein